MIRHKNKRIRWAPALLIVAILSGCKVGPNYVRPVVQTPTTYRDLNASPQLQTQTASFADLPWWQVFQDPQLQELIRTALKQNYDLQIATERINAARRASRDHALAALPADRRESKLRGRQRVQRAKSI